MVTKNPAQYFIREYHDRPITRKEFLQLEKKEITESCISRESLLKGKTLTSAEIRYYQKSGMLSPIKNRSKTFFKREEIQKVIESEASKRPSPQASLF